MKPKKIPLIATLALAALIMGGCTSLNHDTGTRVFDPVKTQADLSPIKGALAGIAYTAARNDPNTRSALRITSGALQTLLEEKLLERDDIRARILEIEIPGMDTTDGRFLMSAITETVLDYYDLMADRTLRPGLDRTPVLQIVLRTMRDAINMALGWPVPVDPPPPPPPPAGSTWPQ